MRLATAPLEGPWVVGLVGGLAALTIAGVGLLAARLVELSRPISPPAPIPSFRLVETGDGMDILLEGSPGRHAIIVDTSGRSHTVTLNRDGQARLNRVHTSTSLLINPAPVTTPPASATAVPKPTQAPRPRPTTPPGAPPILHLVIDSGPSIAITFDGGASSNRTAELLDLLEGLEIKATLFLTGQFIEKHPTLVRRAILDGHEIGNHTFSHPHLTTWEQDRRHRTLPNVTRSWFLSELKRSEEAFQKATGRPLAPLWRAPYGEENATLRAWALEAGYLHVRWSSLEGRSLDSLDWVEDEHSNLYRDSKRIMDILLAFPRLEGGIVLMHLATDRQEAPWAYLPQFVEALRRRGIEPCKVTELLEQSSIWKRWLSRAEIRHQDLWESPVK
ncbi:MAG: polysaccharide deacetylase family protein [Acidobacteria bacterium]|nr:polysaccharide deacetylase family protein [Acidobacteriota bacterium]